MSRIGKKAILIPAGVKVELEENNVVTVTGPKGTLTQKLHPNMIIEVEGAEIKVSRPDEDKFNKSLHGLTRTLVANMIDGVTNGFSKTLKIEGTGYRAVKSGKALQLSLGYSHGITIPEEDGITFECPDSSTIIVKGIDKQRVGEISAVIRKKRGPEPYKGKGIRYSDEHIRRKAGKTGKAAK